ncbi:hypothetical protein [Sporosarcina sp.]|uniref:hypothetical protein n=1 Tax=Sporosarcina sp. TaxID=49982 RepID=UPI00261340B9|nr:hypothetical protein [Sporosarcina sp.]
MGLMINKIEKEVSFDYLFYLNNSTYTLALNGLELEKLLGKQYEKYLNLNEIERFRYRDFFEETKINEMAESLIDGTWIANPPLHVNILKESILDIVCNEESKTIKLSANVEVALLEGYLMYFAIEKALLIEDGLEGITFIVKLTNYDIDSLQKVFSQRIKEGSSGKVN